jgi:tight adherence protein C
MADPTRQRLKEVSTGREQKGRKSSLSRSAEVFGRLFQPKAESERSRIQTLFIHAGMRSPNAVLVFYGVKLMLILGLGGAAALLLLILTPIPLVQIALLATSAAILGYLFPSWWLYRVARQRKQRIRRGLPDALDLLVVCTEAGLGLGASIHRVAGDMAVSHPDLANELDIFSMQTRAGLDHRTALRDFEQRTGVEEVRGLVSTLLQSMTFGTSIAETLRIFADELRDKRMQGAEEEAAKVSTKMLFPLVFCMLPAFFAVALGPAVLGAMRVLSGLDIGG